MTQFVFDTSQKKSSAVCELLVVIVTEVAFGLVITENQHSLADVCPLAVLMALVPETIW